MGFNIPVSTSAGAPPVEDGLALARFDDLTLRDHPDWATESDNFGKPDDGTRFHFGFTMLDDDLTVTYHEGDPIELEALCRQAKGGGLSLDDRSNSFGILSGLLTTAEFEALKVQTADRPADLSAVPGRVVHVKVTHSKKGWPQIDQVISIAKKQAVKA